MALTESEVQDVSRTLTAYLGRMRPPPSIRDKVDLAYRIEDQSVVLFEVRPLWRGPPGEKIELPFAKATYVRSRQHWRVFWQRADLKWHGYEPDPHVNTVDEFLAVVERDEYHCFHG